MKKFIALLAILTLATYLTACTSNDKPAEGDEVLDETEAVDQELENMEGGDSTAATDSEASLDEQLPEDALGESENSAGEVAAGEEPAATEGEQPPAPEIAAEDSTAGTGDSSVPDGFSAAPPTDESSGFVDSGGEPPAPDVAASEPAPETPAETPSEPVAAAEPPPAPKPLLKVEAAPFTRDGMLLNAVYIARPGDTFRSIASTIYGTPDKAEDLKKANSWVSKPKPGTKLYYNSPQRPTDDQRLLTYYEDVGIPAEIYQAQPGENLRTVAKNLLGYDKAWQEVWATNPIESKSDITEPTALRYWKAAPPAPPAQTMAANTPPPEMMPPTNMPPPADLPPPADIPPPADAAAANMAANDFPPPADLPPPPADLPPPPPAEAINPPPPPPPIAKKAPEEGGEAMDQDTIMIAGVGVVLLALVGLIIARKKRQQREMAAAFNDTQVGT